MEKEDENNALLLTAIEKWGVVPQLDMAIEEMSELIQAISKIKREFHRARLKTFQLINQTGKMPEFDNESEALVYQSVCGEIADVKIMLKQLEIIFNKETINLIENRKMLRLKGRLSNC